MGKNPTQEAAALSGNGDKVIFKNAAGGKGFAGSKVITQDGNSQSLKISDLVETKQSAPKEEPKPEPNPAMTADQIQELVNNAMAPVLEQSAAKDAELAQIKAEAEEAKQAAEQAKAEAEAIKNDALEAQQKTEAEAAKLKAELETARKAENAMNELGKLTGGFPMVNTATSIDASPKGLAADFVNALESAPKHAGHSQSFGQFTQSNGRNVTGLIRRSKRDGFYNELVNDVEKFCKQEFGMFTNAVTGASTGAAGRMPDGFLDVLSPFLRETHNQFNVFWQFATTVFDETAVPSKTALVPRWANLDLPTSLADYELGDFDTFTPIAAATGAAGDSEALSQSSVAVTIKEWGRGKGASTRPIYIPEFHQAISLFQALEAVVDSRLMQNYYAFEDLLIRSKFQATTKTLYNVKNAVTATATDIAAVGDLGVLTKNFLHALYGKFHAEQIPAMPNNRFIGVLNSYSAVQLQTSLGEDYRPVSTAQQEEITNMLKVAGGIEIGQATGYFGSYCGFDLFVSNAFGVGADGSEGANDVTLGGSLGDVLGRDNYFFGPGAVGRGIGMPMEIRPSGVNPYSRGESYIWVSHENTDYLDVDSAINAAQQTRVYRVVSLDTAQ